MMEFTHRARPTLDAIFHEDLSFAPEGGWAGLTTDVSTPNKAALSAAIGLGLRRVPIKGSRPPFRPAAAARVSALLADMERDGHQTVGGHCEQGASDPHGPIWVHAMLALLNETRLQGFPLLHARVVAYWSAHFAMLKAFWTLRGFRMPGGRAFPGDLRELAFTVDSFLFARFAGLPTGTLGSLFQGSEGIFELYEACASDLPAIREGMAAGFKLGIPVRRWDAGDGGWTAAFQVPQRFPAYAPLVWLTVDGAGKITDASSTIDDFLPPAGEPVILGL